MVKGLSMGLACNVIALQPPAEGATMLLGPEPHAATNQTLQSCGGEAHCPGGKSERGCFAMCKRASALCC